MFKDSYTIAELEEHRQEWIAALKSGNYKQVHSVLKTNDGYCCLGVACSIAGSPETYNAECRYYQMLDGDKTYENTMPPNVVEYFGFRGDGGNPNTKNLDELWSLNDNGNWSFEQIADHTVANWDAYFTNGNASDYRE